MTNNRPWRDIIDVPEMDWPDWEKRFAGVDGEVRIISSKMASAPPAEKPIKHRWNRTSLSNNIGHVPKASDPRVA